MPPIIRPSVMLKEMLGGTFSIEVSRGTKTFTPMKIKIKETAYLRYANLSIVAERAKYKARSPNIANILLV